MFRVVGVNVQQNLERIKLDEPTQYGRYEGREKCKAFNGGKKNLAKLDIVNTIPQLSKEKVELP